MNTQNIVAVSIENMDFSILSRNLLSYGFAMLARLFENSDCS